jgi:hypothetical protein
MDPAGLSRVARRVAASWDNRIGDAIGRINRDLASAPGPGAAASVLARHGFRILGSPPRFKGEREVSYGRGLPVGDAVLSFENDPGHGIVCRLLRRPVPPRVIQRERSSLGYTEEPADD